ncbi:MAG: CHAT domain-containing tetratricopeptide repeat protein [Cyclobacteriaceae bacterium]
MLNLLCTKSPQYEIPDLILFSFTFVVQSLYAQFGGLGKALKEKAGEVLKDKGREYAEEKVSDKASSYDTTTFNYAIAFLDKAESFENTQEGEGLVKGLDRFLSRDKEKTDLEVARDLYERGRIHYNLRSYWLSEKYLWLSIWAYYELGETQDPVFLKAVGTLGLLYNNMGRYEIADTTNAYALEKWKASEGFASKGYAAEYNNQAVIAFNMGKYNEAEKIFDEAIDLIGSVEGTGSVPYAIANNNLGILYQHMGRSEEALEKINLCLDIAGAELREKSGTYIQLMTNKALILQENKRYGEAEATYQEAIDLQTSRLKLNRKSDPDYAHLLNNMASLYLVTGKTEKVEPLLKESHDIYVSKFGEEHPSTASAKADLGNFYRSQGNLTQANPLLKRAFESRKSSLGTTHPVTIQSQEDLAILQWLQGDVETARTNYNEVMEYSMSFINEFFPPMSEVEKTKYWEKMKNRFFTFYNFALANSVSHPDLVEKMINYRLMTKGMLLSTTTKIKNTILNSGDKALIDLYNQWQDQKRTLAIYYSFSKEEMSKQNVNIDSLENAANQSERQLSQKSSAFADAFVSKDVDYKQVQSKISAGEAVVEVIHYPEFKNAMTGSYKYAAVIIKKVGPPIVSVLENGDQLDTRYHAYYNNVIRNKLKDDFSYEQYWGRINGSLSDIKTIYFSPDGVYSQINLNTLKDPNGKYLVQEKVVKLIGNPKDLLATSTTSSSSTKNAFLLGFPTYGSKDIVPLPGTQKELQQVKSALVSGRYSVQDVTQANATESAIKRVASPKIMHVATHGYFLEDVQSKGSVFGVQVEYAKNNPLLRSGLMLAGASSESDNASFSEEENGILTAYEAMNLNLNKTDLVVLSACETGKGDVQSGEGVYGLQRAFVMAGADKMIMSLWKVDDAATQDLMSRFYRNWILSGQEMTQAFRNAQIQLMSTYPEPYYWGAFVMVGR